MTLARPPPRRRASQARSRATVERILEAAGALIAEKNGEPFTMTEIAHRADVVLGSLYQYFADRSAIHRAILVRHNAEVRIMLQDHLGEAGDLRGFIDGIHAAFARYFALHQQDSFYNGLWSIVQTDAGLQAIDVADTLQNARYMRSVAARFLPDVEEHQLLAACALLIQFALTASRFGRAIPPDLGHEIPGLFGRIVETTFRDLD